MSRANSQSRHNLTEGVVWKQLLVFFLPVAAGTCIQQLYNAVDGMIVGKYVGTVALAAVGGSSAQIINLLIGFFVAVTSGASVVIAQIHGAGRGEELEQATGNALAVSALAGVCLAAMGILLAPAMLRLLQTPADTLHSAVLYLRIYFAGVPLILVLNMESNLLRAVGNSYHPFIDMVAGCVTNIVLDFVFVVFFNWGVAGVAIATVAAQLVNMALETHRLLTTEEAYRLNPRQLRLKGRYLRSMLRLGIPAGLQSSMYSVSNMVIQIGINTLGTVVVASWAMTSKADGIYWAVISAMGTSVTTFVGQNMGAGKTDRAKDCLKQGLLVSGIFTVAISGLIMALGRPLLHILTDDAAVIDTTYQMMTYFVPYYFTWVPIEIYSGVLRGAGDAVRPVVIIGLGVCLFRVVWVLTVFAKLGTLISICLCYAASWLLTGTVFIIYYHRIGGVEALRSRAITGH